MKKFSFQFLLFLIILITGCGGGSSPSVYVAGFTIGTGDVRNAVYWDASGTIVNLAQDASKFSEANDIVINGSTVYVSGYYNSGNAVLWKDKTIVALPAGADDSSAERMFLASDGKLYIAGYYVNGGNVIAAYWVYDGVVAVRHDLTDGTNNALAFSIYVDGADVYVSGMDNEKPVYWKNGVEDSLSTTNGLASSIKVVGGTIHVAGVVVDGGFETFTYWAVTSDVVAVIGFGSGVDVGYPALDLDDELNVYISGNYETGSVMQACYWKNTFTDQNNLSVNSKPYSMAKDILLKGPDVYVVGYYADKESSPTTVTPAYWLNGTRYDLNAGANKKARAYAIDVQE